MWRSCCCCCCFFIRCACYPKYLLRCLIASSYGCLFIFCCCLHFICRCCCCYFVFASCRFRLMVSVRWAHHKGRWYFDWGEMPRVCNVSTEALLSWGQATVNHGAQKVKCLFTCDIGFIGHDSGSILFVYRIFRERKKSASDGIRMHFCVLVFSLLFFYFFFVVVVHLHDSVCTFELCAIENRDIGVRMANGEEKRVCTPNKAPIRLGSCCIVQWTSTLAMMTFWYFERQWKTAHTHTQMLVTFFFLRRRSLSENAG